MNKLTSFLEKFVNLLAYLKIVLSPSIIGGFIGVVIYANKTDDVGLLIAIVIAILGIISGVILAEWARKKGGATEFISRVNTSPDIDEAVQPKSK